MRTRLGASILLAACAAIPMAGQSAKGVRSDLQGVWSFSTLTPLERPAEFSGKEFLTDAEAAALTKRTLERNNGDNRDTSNPDSDVGGAYNEFWWDRGTTLARVNGKYRTSLITDPPDGRIPAQTAASQQRAAARAAQDISERVVPLVAGVLENPIVAPLHRQHGAPRFRER